MSNHSSNWVYRHKDDEHTKSKKVLNKVKKERQDKKFKLVQTGPKTWKEVEVTDE